MTACALMVAVVAAVLAAVHHAEVIALRVGEPFGAILLALAVTVIELGLIVSIMLGDKPEPALMRDILHERTRMNRGWSPKRPHAAAWA